MSEEDQRQKETASLHGEGEELSATDTFSARADQSLATVDGGDGFEPPAAAQLGSARYVMAGFFVTGIFAAFLIGKMISSVWGNLVELSWTQKHLVVLAQVGEEQRAEICTVVGGVVSVFLTIYLYRRSDIREWTEAVADELAKVTWPDKAEVTNSTVTVLLASAFATLYLALLDRVWGFLTNLVYGG